jgi:hypothetical protein
MAPMNFASAQHLAVHCQYLKRSLDRGSAEQVLTICQHPVREGSACIGPFLEDLSTQCGLWESVQDRHLVASPNPDNWQRNRRGDYDFSRGGR